MSTQIQANTAFEAALHDLQEMLKWSRVEKAPLPGDVSMRTYHDVERHGQTILSQMEVTALFAEKADARWFIRFERAATTGLYTARKVEDTEDWKKHVLLLLEDTIKHSTTTVATQHERAYSYMHVEKQYQVIWKFDIYATSPTEAAGAALLWMKCRDEKSFRVKCEDGTEETIVLEDE